MMVHVNMNESFDLWCFEVLKVVSAGLAHYGVLYGEQRTAISHYNLTTSLLYDAKEGSKVWEYPPPG